MEKLLEMLHRIRPDVDFESCENLVFDGIIESFDIVMIMGAISEEYGITVPPREIKIQNFNSAKAMLEMIERINNQ